MRVLSIILLLMIVTRCSPEIQAHTDYDPDYDLWKYETVAWSEQVNSDQNRNPLYYSDLNDQRIRQAVNKQLKKHQYKMVSGPADLSVRYHIIVEDKSTIVTEPFGYVYGPYWMRRQQHIYTYTQGTLIVDLLDTRINQLVWRGWAVSAVDGIESPEQIERLIDEAVRKMFVKFPNRKVIL